MRNLEQLNEIVNIDSDDVYIRITWPNSQDYIGCDWFVDEAVADMDESGAYLIPANRLIENNTND